MGKIIPVSFKINEQYLYEEIVKHSSYSGYIKECIKKCINSDIKNSPKSEGKSNTNEIDSILNSL